MLPISDKCSYQQLFYENLREIDSSCEFFWLIVRFQNKTERRNLRMKSYPIKFFFFLNTLNINLLSSHLLCLVQFWKYKMWDERKHKSNSTRTELDLQNHTKPHLVLHFAAEQWQTGLYQDETVHERIQWHGLRKINKTLDFFAIHTHDIMSVAYDPCYFFQT